jgi:hypothetical protein
MRNLDGIFTEGSEENEDSILGLKTRLRYLRFPSVGTPVSSFLGRHFSSKCAGERDPGA